jgi:hypothetical protein
MSHPLQKAQGWGTLVPLRGLDKTMLRKGWDPPQESARGDRTHRSAVMKAGSRESPLLEKREKGGTPGVLFQI